MYYQTDNDKTITMIKNTPFKKEVFLWNIKKTTEHCKKYSSFQPIQGHRSALLMIYFNACI